MHEKDIDVYRMILNFVLKYTTSTFKSNSYNRAKTSDCMINWQEGSNESIFSKTNHQQAGMEKQ